MELSWSFFIKFRIHKGSVAGGFLQQAQKTFLSVLPVYQPLYLLECQSVALRYCLVGFSCAFLPFTIPARCSTFVYCLVMQMTSYRSLILQQEVSFFHLSVPCWHMRIYSLENEKGQLAQHQPVASIMRCASLLRPAMSQGGLDFPFIRNICGILFLNESPLICVRRNLPDDSAHVRLNSSHA